MQSFFFSPSKVVFYRYYAIYELSLRAAVIKFISFDPENSGASITVFRFYVGQLPGPESPCIVSFPSATEVPIYKEHFHLPIHQELLEKEPLDDLEEVIPSIRMAVEMVERDVPSLPNTCYDLYDNHYNDVSYEVPGGVTFNTSARKPLNPSSVMLPVLNATLTYQL
ncbi:hypothetical protein G6F24_012335 [Rhizopus arrhizus]|nr:hypothetical protein G6F24_012335 [Rhizopus arrhizus]